MINKLAFQGVLLLFFTSFNLMAGWEQCSNGMNPGSVYSFLVIENNMYAGTSSGIFVSSNYGSSWTQTSFNNNIVYSLVTNGSFIFASTMDNGVYRSSDNGGSWLQTSLDSGTIHSLAVKGPVVYAANQINVFSSINNGISWQVIYSSQYPTIGSMAENGNTFFVGEHGVFISSNNGSNWIQTLNTYPYIVNSLASKGNNVFAGTYGVFRSTDNGSAWNQVGLNSYYIRALYIHGENIFAGTNNNGVFVSNNNGESWVSKSEGLGATPPIIKGLCVSGNYIFAGTWLQNVYRRPLNEFTGIMPISSGIPNDYSLCQNYPNPFNPATKIRFGLPDHPGAAGGNSEFVQVKLYDNLGRDIATLVNGHLSPGMYEVEWNASNYPSGIYYYRITIRSDKSLSNDYSDTKKMILVK